MDPTSSSPLGATAHEDRGKLKMIIDFDNFYYYVKQNLVRFTAFMVNAVFEKSFQPINKKSV